MRSDTLALHPGLHWEAVSELAGYGEQRTTLVWPGCRQETKTYANILHLALHLLPFSVIFLWSQHLSLQYP